MRRVGWGLRYYCLSAMLTVTNSTTTCVANISTNTSSMISSSSHGDRMGGIRGDARVTPRIIGGAQSVRHGNLISLGLISPHLTLGRCRRDSIIQFNLIRSRLLV